MLSFAQRLALASERFADRTALVEGERRWTHAAWYDSALALSAFLQAQGVGPGRQVYTLLERSADQVLACVAILLNGATYIPLDPAYPPARLHAITEQLDNPLCLDADFLDAFRRAPARAPRTLPTPDPETVATMLFTSGTTGVPKGVMVPYRGLNTILSALLQSYPFHEGLRYPTLTSPTFDVSLHQMLLPLITGAELHIVSRALQGSYRALRDYFVTHRIDAISCVPSFLTSFLTHIPPLTEYPIAYLMPAGERFSTALYRLAREKLRCEQILNLYGPTEASIYATCHPCEDSDLDEGATDLPIGRALPGYHLAVLDEAQQPLPSREVGELYIGGSGVALGYYRMAERTAEKFLALPSIGPGTFFRTGDRVRQRPDGTVEYLGRFDHQIKLRGYRIELPEIERHLLESGQIHECAVVLGRDGAGEPALVAYLLLREGATVAELERFLQARLPAFMVPAHLIPLPVFPLLPNGKTDRKALELLPLAPAASAAPLGESSSSLNEYEQAVLDFWRASLGAPSLGPDEELLRWGLDSLRLFSFIAWHEQRQGAVSSLALVQGATTARQLARLAPPPPPRLPVSTPQPLSPTQRAGLRGALRHLHQSLLAEPAQDTFPAGPFVEKLLSRGTREIIPLEIYLDAGGNPRRLLAQARQGLRHLVREQELLRSRLLPEPTTHFAIHSPPRALVWPLLNLEGERDAQRLRVVRDELSAYLTEQGTSNGPLWGGCLLRWSSGDLSLLFGFDHLLADGDVAEIVPRYFALKPPATLKGGDSDSFGAFVACWSAREPRHQAATLHTQPFWQAFESATLSFRARHPEQTAVCFSPPQFLTLHLPPPDVQHPPLGLFLLCTGILVRGLFGVAQVPGRLLDSRRRLAEQTFYHTIGCFHDCLPVVVGPEETPAQLYQHVQQLRRFAEQASLYYAALAPHEPSVASYLYRSPLRLNYLGFVTPAEAQRWKEELAEIAPNIPYTLTGYVQSSRRMEILLLNGLPPSLAPTLLAALGTWGIQGAVEPF